MRNTFLTRKAFGSLISRKGGLRLAIGLGLSCMTASVSPARSFFTQLVSPLDVPSPLRSSDKQFVDDIEQRAVLFFEEHTDETTGLTRDRAPADGNESHAPASIAATGFALSAWCIADQRGFLTHTEARNRVLTTLKFVANKAPQQHGWLYHFMDAHTGARYWDCEASTIDTALFLQGAIVAREYFNDREVRDLVNQIYGRIDFRWALDSGATVTHGWRPETGFIQHRWDSYAEMLGLYLIGIGAPKNPLPPETWKAWKRGPVVNYDGRTFIQCAPLFTHQYTQAYFDFRGLRDGTFDYWQNSVDATLAQREWCASRTSDFPQWSRELWGVTACDGPNGYSAQGGPFGSPDKVDGTLAPCAPGGSLPFAPHECLSALKEMRLVGGNRIWGRYGFADAFNPQTGWVASDVIGIDVGITLLMSENMRTGMVWQDFMHAPEVQRGMKLAGFAPHQQTPQSIITTVATIPFKLPATIFQFFFR